MSAGLVSPDGFFALGEYYISFYPALQQKTVVNPRFCAILSAERRGRNGSGAAARTAFRGFREPIRSFSSHGGLKKTAFENKNRKR